MRQSLDRLASNQPTRTNSPAKDGNRRMTTGGKVRAFLRSSSSNNSGFNSSNVEKAYSISKLISRRYWGSLRKVLRIENVREELFEAIMSSEDNPAETALHCACQNHAPYDIVKLIAQSFPETIVHVDNVGRYALHQAAHHGCSPRVIKFLCDAHPPSVASQDVMGKTALHLLCEFYGDKYSPRQESGLQLKDAMLECVKIMTKAAPSAVNFEDMDGISALEYAIEADMDLKVIRSIQKASEKDWRNRRTTGENHANVENRLQEQFQDRKAQIQKDILELTNFTVLMSVSNENEETDTARSLLPGLCKEHKQSSRALKA